MEKEVSASLFSFAQYTSVLCIQNLKTLAVIGSETSVTDIGENKKWTNKGNDKQEDSL